MSDSLLSVSLEAGYSKSRVLKQIDFSVHAGERMGLLGSSGAGKSTLLLALLGLLPWKGGWAKGEVLLDGKNLLALPEREARRLRGNAVALIPQSPLTALNSAVSLQTHFLEAWRAHGGAKSDLGRRLDQLMPRVNLPVDQGFLKRKPGEISVGQAQRVTIALALLHRPSLLIADEPTSALDPVTQADVLTLLRYINEEEGTALLYISHDLLSVLQLCQRVALLSQGCIVENLHVDNLDTDVTHAEMRAWLRTLPAPVGTLLTHAKSRHERRTKAPELSTLPSSLEAYNLGAMVSNLISK